MNHVHHTEEKGKRQRVEKHTQKKSEEEEDETNDSNHFSQRSWYTSHICAKGSNAGSNHHDQSRRKQK